MTNKPAEHPRLIVAEGNGKPVIRSATRQNRATVAVFINPPGTATQGLGNPAVRLVVEPDGRWRVETHDTGWDNPAHPWATVARGYVTADGQHRDGDPDGYAWRFNRHKRADGSGCGWSFCSVVEPAQRTEPGDRRCPDGCPASDVEPNPDADALSERLALMTDRHEPAGGAR